MARDRDPTLWLALLIGPLGLLLLLSGIFWTHNWELAVSGACMIALVIMSSRVCLRWLNRLL
jgi:prepilin signal peptidase PulO-like enzyme (type II secretory pathway)